MVKFAMIIDIKGEGLQIGQFLIDRCLSTNTYLLHSQYPVNKKQLKYRNKRGKTNC